MRLEITNDVENAGPGVVVVDHFVMMDMVYYLRSNGIKISESHSKPLIAEDEYCTCGGEVFRQNMSTQGICVECHKPVRPGTEMDQSKVIARIEEICEEFDARVADVGLPIARLELAKALAESEATQLGDQT